MTGGQIHDSLRTKIFWVIKLFVQLIFATLFKNKAELFVFPIKPIRSSNMISKKKCNIVERFFLRIKNRRYITTRLLTSFAKSTLLLISVDALLIIFVTLVKTVNLLKVTACRRRGFCSCHCSRFTPLNNFSTEKNYPQVQMNLRNFFYS